MRRNGTLVALLGFTLLLLASSGGGLLSASSTGRLPPPASPAAAASQISGDANCDGAVNSIDALQVLRSVAELSAADCVQDNGDVNCDEAVNSVDALKILRYVAGLPSDTAGCTPIGEPLATSDELIDEALANGDITDEEATVYRVFAAFGDSRLPDEYHGAPSDLPDSHAAMDAAAKFNNLSPEAQETLRPFLTPPYAEGSWLNPTAPGGAAAASPTEHPEEWATFDAAAGRVKVWGRIGHRDEVTKAQAVAAAVTETIWPSLVGLMGEEHAPLPDSGWPHNGLSSALDIYVMYGVDSMATSYRMYDFTDPTCLTSPVYIYLNALGSVAGRSPQNLLATAVHEMFHAIQYSYDVLPNCWSSRQYHWFTDATAMWAEDYVYPQTNNEHIAAPYFLEHPEASIDWNQVLNHEYGAYLFPFYFTHKLNAPELVRSAWETFATQSSLPGVQAVLEPYGGFEALWPEFVLYNLNREETPVHFYWDWDRLESLVPPQSILGKMVWPGDTAELAEEVQYLSARYYNVFFPDWDKDPVRSVTFNNTLFCNAHANVQALLKIGDTWQAPRDWTEKEEVTFCRDEDESKRIEEIIIIISNSDWEGRKTLTPAEQPSLVGSDVPCAKWTGQVTRVGTWGGSVPGDSEVQEKVVARDLVFVRDPSRSTEKEWVYPLESGTVELSVSGWATPCRQGTGSGTTAINGSTTVAIGPSNGAGWLKVSKPGVPQSERKYLGSASAADLSLHIVLECTGGGTETYDWNLTEWFDMGDAQPLGDDPSTLAGEYTDPYWGHYQWEFHAAP